MIMGSYGDYGYGFEDNYGYGNVGDWQQDGGRNRKRRGNFDQMQQFEQRQSRRWGNNQSGWGNYQDGWGSNQGGWGDDQGGWGGSQEGWQGNQGGWGGQDGDWYGDESYDDGYYGGSQWDDDGEYDDGYGGSRKRSRFYDDDPRGGQYMERGPHSVNFYDDYEEPYYRSGPRQGRRRNDGDRSGRKRRRENDYGRARSARRRRRDSNNPDAVGRKRGVHKKSEAEDAIYEKHKKVTVERTKREKIGNVVHAVVFAIKDVNQKLVQEQQVIEKPVEEPTAAEESTEMQVEAKNSHEVESESKAVSGDTATAAEAGVEETKQNEENIPKQDDCKEPSKEKKANGKATESKPKVKFDPILLGAVKCGESAMRILVGENLQATVVVISKKKPTRWLVAKCRDLLDEALNEYNENKEEQFHLEISDDRETLILKQDVIPNFHVLIRFTSPECSPDGAADGEEEPAEDPVDVLSPENCAIALTQLRRMRFFCKKLDSSAVSLTVIRILLFFRESLEGWDKMPVWLALLLVSSARVTLVGKKPDFEKEIKLYRVDALLIRCLEILSAGVLLPNNLGIKDVCEADRDAGEDLSVEEADTITRSAQHVLRQIYFGHIRSVLGLELKNSED